MSLATSRRLDKLEETIGQLRVPKALAALFDKAAKGPPSTVAHDLLGVTLSAPQATVLDDPARFKLLIAGRRFGKSYTALVASITDALRGPRRVVWVVSPTYRSARDVNWPLLRRLVPSRSVVGTPRETDLSVTLKNGSVIALRSGDEPDLLRGSGLDLVVLDEASQLSEDLWSIVLRPALADREGRALFATTPRGTTHWIHDLWEDAEQDPAWARWQYPTIEGGRVSAEELRQAARVLSGMEFRQEFEADFTAVGGRVYQDFSLEAWSPDGWTGGNIDPKADDLAAGETEPPEDPRMTGRDQTRPWQERTGFKSFVPPQLTPSDIPIHVGFDPGMKCGIIFATITRGGDLLVFDAACVSDSHTAAVADQVAKRFKGRRVIFYPDPAGQQRRSSAGHLTDHLILRQAGFQVVAPSAALPVADRVNVVRSLVFSADGRRRLRINPQAETLIRAFDCQEYDPRTESPSKKTGHDHVLDALGYLCVSAANLLYTRAQISFSTLSI